MAKWLGKEKKLKRRGDVDGIDYIVSIYCILCTTPKLIHYGYHIEQWFGQTITNNF